MARNWFNKCCSFVAKGFDKIANLVRKGGTVKALIREPDGKPCVVDTEYSLEDLIKSLEGTGCTVELYDNEIVEVTEDEVVEVDC